MGLAIKKPLLDLEARGLPTVKGPAMGPKETFSRFGGSGIYRWLTVQLWSLKKHLLNLEARALLMVKGPAVGPNLRSNWRLRIYQRLRVRLRALKEPLFVPSWLLSSISLIH